MMLGLILAGFGTGEFIMIGLAVALIFGATRVPLLMKGLGQGIKEFKQAVKDDDGTEPVAAGGPKPENP